MLQGVLQHPGLLVGFQLCYIGFPKKVQKRSGHRRKAGRGQGGGAKGTIARRLQRQRADVEAEGADRRRRANGNAKSIFYHGKHHC